MSFSVNNLTLLTPDPGCHQPADVQTLILSCSVYILAECWTCSFVAIMPCITTQATLINTFLARQAVTGSLKAAHGHTVNWPSPSHPASPSSGPLRQLYFKFFDSTVRREAFKTPITVHGKWVVAPLPGQVGAGFTLSLTKVVSAKTSWVISPNYFKLCWGIVSEEESVLLLFSQDSLMSTGFNVHTQDRLFLISRIHLGSNFYTHLWEFRVLHLNQLRPSKVNARAPKTEIPLLQRRRRADNSTH